MDRTFLTEYDLIEYTMLLLFTFIKKDHTIVEALSHR